MRILIATLTSFSLVAGCAAKSENVVALYQSPVKYQHLSCDQISTELERVSSNVLQLANAQDDARVRDQIATGAGIVLFWPALFVLAAGDKENQLAQMKGEFEALETAYAQKKCAVMAPSGGVMPVSVTEIGARATPTRAYTPLPNGTPAPHEGVRLASYTALEMQWFCKHDWRSRASPEGRTEFNPCHMPEMFIR